MGDPDSGLVSSGWWRPWVARYLLYPTDWIRGGGRKECGCGLEKQACGDRPSVFLRKADSSRPRVNRPQHGMPWIVHLAIGFPGFGLRPLGNSNLQEQTLG
jgi:hypothetical protein